MGDVIRFPGPQRALPIQGQPKYPTPRPRQSKPQPKPVQVCWACGTHKSEPGRDYCTGCTIKGLDTPLVPCTADGCNTVGRRRWRGQTHFTCPSHRQDAS